MFERIVHRSPVAPRRAAVLLVLAAAVAFAGTAKATPAADLGEEARQTFEVLPLREGVLLKPRQAKTYSVIEITDSGVAVDGEELSGRDLRRRLGGDAGVVEAIADLESDERRSLAGGSAAAVPNVPPPAVPPGVAAPPAPPAVPEAPEPPPARPRRHGSDAKVSVASSAHVARGETSDDVVVFGGEINVEGEVLGDAVAIGGSVRIDGKVTGDVVSVGGDIELGPSADILGKVTSVGGHITRDPAAHVIGSTSEVAMGPLLTLGALSRLGKHHSHVDVSFEPFERVTSLLSAGLRVALLGLFGCLIILLMRQPLERVGDKIAEEPWRSGLTGLAAQVLIAPLFFITLIVLLVSVIGIPLIVLLPFALLALIVGAFLGYTAVALRLGRWAGHRFGWHIDSPYLVLFVGVVIVQATTLFGRTLDWDVAPLGFFAGLLLFAGFVIQYVVWTVGLGAVLITRFGTYAVWRGWRWHRPDSMPGAFRDEERFDVPPPPLDPSPRVRGVGDPDAGPEDDGPEAPTKA